MDTKRIIWSKKACTALDVIFNYIARDSEYNASRFISKIKKDVERLLLFPELGKLLEEDDKTTARVLIIKDYKIIYEPIETGIYIHTVIHGKRLSDYFLI